MAEIMANTLYRYLIGIRTDFLLAEVLIHMLFSNSYTSVYQFSIWLQFSNATFWEHAHASTSTIYSPTPTPCREILDPSLSYVTRAIHIQHTSTGQTLKERAQNVLHPTKFITVLNL